MQSRVSEYLIYLAGPITGLTYDGATDWREYVRSRLPYPVVGLSPMRGKAELRGARLIRNSYSDPLKSGKGITGRDRFDVARSTAVLMNLLGARQVSIGTMLEDGWTDAYRKPLILALRDGDIHDHAMLREVATYVVDDLDRAVELVVKLVLPDPPPREPPLTLARLRGLAAAEAVDRALDQIDAQAEP